MKERQTGETTPPAQRPATLDALADMLAPRVATILAQREHARTPPPPPLDSVPPLSDEELTSFLEQFGYEVAK